MGGKRGKTKTWWTEKAVFLKSFVDVGFLKGDFFKLCVGNNWGGLQEGGGVVNDRTFAKNARKSGYSEESRFSFHVGKKG